MALGHPPLDFAPYGPAARWDGPEWLEQLTGPLGHPAEGVWLGHGAATVHDARTPWLRVATLRRDRLVVPDRETSTAFSALFRLVDATMPAPADRGPDYPERVVDMAHERAALHAQWRTAAWTVDGTTLRAPVVEWAGAWAGFTCDVPDVDLVVVAHGIDPDGLDLVRVDDTSRYHFDRSRPVVFPDTVEQSRDTAGAQLGDDEAGGWPLHPDHASLA